MAPNPKGIIRPRSLKNRSLACVSVFKRVNPHLRPADNLLSNPPISPKLQKGYPVFPRKPDILNKFVTGFRKYKPPPKPFQPIKRDYDETNFNEIISKFRFELRGRFQENGNIVRWEILKMGYDLNIVGWIKCRSRFAVGHLQGDVYAMSSIRRLMDVSYLKGARISSMRIYDENFGLPETQYKTLIALDDRRKPARIKMHRLQTIERTRTHRHRESSLKQMYEEDAFLAEHKVRNY